MQRFQTGDQALVREMNLSSVMRYIHNEAPISRAQLARLTGLNKSTVSSLVEDLLDYKLIHEVGVETSRTGRPATLLDVNPHAGCIGVELSVDSISVILSNLVGEISWRCSQEIDPESPQQTIISSTLALVDQAKTFSQTASLRILGVGLTLPGMVDPETGVLKFSPNLQWHDVPLGDVFRQHLDLPIYVDNDANAAALGEHLFGFARTARNFVFVVAGVGIGGGLFLNGRLYRGTGGFAGEIGHTSVTPEQSRLCRCGNRGCWENFGNQYSLIERVRSRLDVGRRSVIPQLCTEQNSPLNLSIIAQAAEAGDSEALDALEYTGEAIGLGVANLINIFNPELVVIGGAMSVVGEHLMSGINSAVKKRAILEPRQQAQVLLSAFGTEANVMGAVALVVEAILVNPSQVKKAPSSSEKMFVSGAS